MVMAQHQPQELDLPDDDIERDSNGHFAPGNRGGPGRPRSAISRSAVALDAMGADVGKKIVQVMVDRALDGDMRAADLLLSRIWPARRGRPVEIDAMPLKALPDYVAAATDVANAVMRGEMTPHEGQALSRVLDTQIRSIDATDVELRLREVDEAVARNKEKDSDPFTGLYPTDSTTVFDRLPDGSDDEKA
jgi:hypothetical protein